MELYFQRLRKTPNDLKHHTSGSAGLDLSVSLEYDDYVEIQPNEYKMVGSGIAVEIPLGYVGLVFIRSSTGTKGGLCLNNCVGVIDSDYRGEIMLPLRNTSKELKCVKNGDRVAQLVIMPYLATSKIIEKEELNNTERGTGGFGSSNV